jgi:hypothetical protein
LSRQWIRRAVFFSVEDLQNAIRESLDGWNENPKPFVWTATVQSIMEKLSPAVGKSWRRFNPAALCHGAEKKSNGATKSNNEEQQRCLVISQTLH